MKRLFVFFAFTLLVDKYALALDTEIKILALKTGGADESVAES